MRGAAFFLQGGAGQAGKRINSQDRAGQGGAGQEQKFVARDREKQCVNRKFMRQKITKNNFTKGWVTYYGTWVPCGTGRPSDRIHQKK